MIANKRFSVFDVFNYVILALLAIICVIPFINVLAVSLSGSEAVTAGKVYLLPVNFHMKAYEFALSRPRFIGSALNSVERLLLGVGINLLLTVLAAYPLSKSKKVFPGRSILSWFFVITMLVNAGVVPRYIVVAKTGLIDHIWALIIPSAVPAFCITILLNFFRGIPAELEESAFLDGAGHIRILFMIYLPLSLPALATLTVNQAVAHWNEWFEGMVYMNNITKYPLSSYLRNVVVNPSFDTFNLSEATAMSEMTNRSFTAAQIMLGSLPILAVYPFMQKYFVKGMMLGSVKG